MTISGVSWTIAPLVQSVLNINDQLTDLQRQLGTGRKPTPMLVLVRRAASPCR